MGKPASREVRCRETREVHGQGALRPSLFEPTVCQSNDNVPRTMHGDLRKFTVDWGGMEKTTVLVVGSTFFPCVGRRDARVVARRREQSGEQGRRGCRA
ncbi:MAG: hypothetical protein WCN98_16140 [Verrucomicrobiaceae bacterium]